MVAIFVLATIVLFLLADGVVLYMRRRRAGAPAPGESLARLFPSPQAMPSGMFVHPSHVWLTVDPMGPVRVGLDELAQRLIGPVAGVRFPAVGRHVERGETLFSVQSGDYLVPIPSPVSGVLEATQVPPQHGKSDPTAWFVSVRPDRLGDEIRPLRLAEDAARWLGQEFGRLRETLHGLRLSPAGATLPDGGEPADGLLGVLDPTAREIVVRAFLRAQD